VRHSRDRSAGAKHALAPSDRGHWPAVFAQPGTGVKNSTQDRRHVYRALRLTMALGLAGAALCLLLAMIAMVVSMGGAAVTGAAPALILLT
jgi:hypothetical protein